MSDPVTCFKSSGRLFEPELAPITEDPRSFVLAATAWATNAELIEDCARLGYLRPEWNVLDATYGKGMWWTRWRPASLVTNDLDTEKPADYHHDFRDMPWDDDSFDAVTYDPPYIAPGGRSTSTVEDFNGRFGLHTTPAKPHGLQKYINAGLEECARVTAPGGFILAKCKNYVNGGALWPGEYLTWTHGVAMGLKFGAVFQHLSGTGPQSQTTQEHPRSNYSTLLVFKKPAYFTSKNRGDDA